jgi:hypothetical protein
MAHGAKLLIKFAGLAPDLVDATGVATDVELLVEQLSEGTRTYAFTERQSLLG